MKRVLLLITATLVACIILAQVPQSFKYQTVVRDAGGTIIASHDVGFRISILKGSSTGTVAYKETFTAATNQFGLATLNLGQGSVVSGIFNAINWADDSYFVRVEVDPAGGSAYTDAGTSQLLSVPYALQSEKVQKLSDEIPSTGDMLYYDGTKWMNISPGQPGQFLQLQTTNLPKWSGPAFPTLTTSSVSNISPTTALCGGNITNDGGGTIQERGVCWSTSPDPTIADSKTSDGSGKGSFVSAITGLAPNTTYYVRAYATNWSTAYGNQLMFTTIEGYSDYDGNIYNTVTLGTQTWMIENLKTTHYRDGTPITLVENAGEWNRTIEGYCWNENNISNKDPYGALYNFYAVTDAHQLCPLGWHVPTDTEWETLENYLIDNGYNYDGTTSGNKIAKAMASASSWTTSTETGSVGNSDYPEKRNVTGFTALPGGHREADGNYLSVGSFGTWWSATGSLEVAWYHQLLYNLSSVYRSTGSYKYGFSVRCMKD